MQKPNNLKERNYESQTKHPTNLTANWADLNQRADSKDGHKRCKRGILYFKAAFAIVMIAVVMLQHRLGHIVSIVLITRCLTLNHEQPNTEMTGTRKDRKDAESLEIPRAKSVSQHNDDAWTRMKRKAQMKNGTIKVIKSRLLTRQAS